MANMQRAENFPLHRRDVAKRLAEAGGADLLIVTGLGSTNWDFTAAGDRDLTFPLWGAMGGAVPLALGLALAQPDRRVLVATGDGEMLMGLGSLATVAIQAPHNLAIAVFDNERYGETGMQATATAYTADLAAAALACGIETAGTARTEDELTEAIPDLVEKPGPIFYVIKVQAEPLDFILPPKDGVYLKNRFRRALLGTDGIL